jgi:hypothetical protein
MRYLFRLLKCKSAEKNEARIKKKQGRRIFRAAAAATLGNNIFGVITQTGPVHHVGHLASRLLLSLVCVCVCVKHAFKITPATQATSLLWIFVPRLQNVMRLLCHRAGTDLQQIFTS